MAKFACVDIGGTFTDAAILDETGCIQIFKSPTTPHDYAEGMLGALKNAAEFYDISLEQLLKDISVKNGGRLTHGSTIATNAILEKKAGKVGMITTKGFRDVLLFREGPPKNPHDLYLDFPEPFVPRYLTFGVEERINSEGGVEVPLNEDEVIAAAKQLAEYNVEAIAVCFLWSPVNAAHERRAKEIIKEEFPDIPVVISADVNPQINEYRRFVSTAMDASLRRLVSIYSKNLNKNLNDQGYIGEVGMLNAYGGVMSPIEISESPLLSIDSGPAMAPVSGREYVNMDANDKNAVVMDMGGTTFDVSCVIDNHIGISRETVIGDEVPGIARVGVHSIGAGGGSIAWVDAGGMLRVGPQSAGSVPGPACYCRGGKLPTVTDANVILGYLNPANFNNGKMTLDVQCAWDAIEEHVAKKLDMDVYEAAYAIWGTVNANMVKAIKDVTVWQGVDPRGYVMVAGGGACGTHAIPLSVGLEMKKLIIPKTAGGLSAAGGLFSDLTKEFSITLYQETRMFDYAMVTQRVRELQSQAEEFLERNNIAPENRKIELYMEGRYPSQAWDLSVLAHENLFHGFTFTEDFVKELEEAFHTEHFRQFAVKDNSYVNCFVWRVRAVGKVDEGAKLRELADTPDKTPPVMEETRKMYFKELGGVVDAPAYNGVKLKYGQVVHGPAVVEEPTTTITVLPKYTLEVTKYGDYYFDIDV
ncbi:MAG: hydantoinase/oxoprolinase family protein [Christensenellaceae bacterium]|jgi:N-methylhydantoinase A